MTEPGRVRSWHLHRWSKWSEPVEQPMLYLRSGKTMQYHEDIQRRSCEVCNAVQERTL